MVSRHGSIDWLCLPRFDSPACLAALLGTPEHGFWRVAPVGRGACNRRAYRPDTLVLDSGWESEQGAVRVTDFMPPRTQWPCVVRVIEGLSGAVPMRSELRLRFHHGRAVPRTRGVVVGTVAVSAPVAAELDVDYPAPLCHREDSTVVDF